MRLLNSRRWIRVVLLHAEWSFEGFKSWKMFKLLNPLLFGERERFHLPGKRSLQASRNAQSRVENCGKALLRSRHLITSASPTGTLGEINTFNLLSESSVMQSLMKVEQLTLLKIQFISLWHKKSTLWHKVINYDIKC